MDGTAGVFAGVLDIDDQSGEIFEQYLRGKPGVAAGAAGCDNEIGMLPEQRRNLTQRFFAESDGREVEIKIERARSAAGCS